MATQIRFSGSPLDRVDAKRRDEAWLAQQRSSDQSRFLAVWRLEPLVKTGESRSLAWARPVLFDDLDPAPEPVLLGVSEGVAHFAVDVSALEKPMEELGVDGAAAFENLGAVAAQIPAGEAAIAAQARSLVDWHARHPCCAACGGATRPQLGGGQRRCIECAVEHFPRTDPVVIAAVVRGDRCLLGRGHRWPDGMYSALAGFVEPGESLEEAVRREVHEESGVSVGAVRYMASQPWPFPSSLMIGFLAEAESEELRIDPAELADARWFGRDTVRAALERSEREGFAPSSDAELVVPPAQAIAHHLIRAWVEGR